MLAFETKALYEEEFILTFQKILWYFVQEVFPLVGIKLMLSLKAVNM